GISRQVRYPFAMGIRGYTGWSCVGSVWRREDSNPRERRYRARCYHQARYSPEYVLGVAVTFVRDTERCEPRQPLSQWEPIPIFVRSISSVVSKPGSDPMSCDNVSADIPSDTARHPALDAVFLELGSTAAGDAELVRIGNLHWHAHSAPVGRCGAESRDLCSGQLRCGTVWVISAGSMHAGKQHHSTARVESGESGSAASELRHAVCGRGHAGL